MIRIVSGAVLLAITVAVVWFASAPVFLAAALVLVCLAFFEYAGLARASRQPIPGVAGLCAAAVCASFSRVWGGSVIPLDVVLMSAFVLLGSLSLTAWRSGSEALGRPAAAVFPSIYLGLPIGALVAIREANGREALVLLMLTIIVSDTAQYYTGRTFGRRLLSPEISPKKTVAGAVGGFVGGALFLWIAGAWWMAPVPAAFRAVIGATMVALGIAGDLFESMLKRGAGVKDSSTLIPGHGGVLDRIDALLFAAPVYYVVLRYL